VKDKTFLIQGNMPLLLEDASKSYIVSKGRVDLFFTGTEKGKALGRRSYFFTAQEGDVIIGASPKDHAFLLTGPHGSEVKEILTKDLLKRFAKGNDLDLLERFVVNISNFAPVGHAIEKITSDSPVKIKAGTFFRSEGKVGWVELKKGSINLPEGFKGFFPVTHKSFALATEESDLIIHSTKKIAKDIEKHFYNYLNFMLGSYTSSFEDLKKKNVSAFRERLRRTGERMNTTLRGLVSLFFPGEHLGLLDLKGDPYLVAAKAVGFKEDINVVEPKFKGEAYAKDPLAEISRVSKFMTRKIVLSGR